jgi:penicillin-binding protein 1C
MRNVSGVSGAGPLFRDIMLLLEKREKRINSNFAIPDGLIEVYVCPRSGMLAGSSCSGRIKEMFIKGTEPEKVCNLHFNTLLASSKGR